MSYTITVPQDYRYVLLALTSTFFVNEWLAFRIVPFRSAAGIKTPHPYASPEQIASAPAASTDGTNTKEAMYLFNCAQRAQANFVEHHATVLGAMLIAGLEFPRATAALGAVWSVSRVLFGLGYTKRGAKDGSARVIGEGALLANFALVPMAAWAAWKMV